MNVTLKNQISNLEGIIANCLLVSKQVQDKSAPWMESLTVDAVNRLKSDYFSKLAEEVMRTIQIINHDGLYIQMTDYDYNKLVADAEQTLTELPFGGCEWLRQYGYIEGLKQVKFFTKTFLK